MAEDEETMMNTGTLMFRVEIEDDKLEEKHSDNIMDFSSVEFEVMMPDRFADERRTIINANINEIDNRIEELNAKVSALNSEIDRLTNTADGLDYVVAVASGVLAGAIDVFFVDNLSLTEASEWGNEKASNFVVKVAQKQGYKGDDLYGAVKHLEKKFPIAADAVTSEFGGGLQHHLRDFSHHPTPVGLFFSLLTQFTYKAYGTDVVGAFQIVDIKKEDWTFIGKNLPEKIMFGVINWFFHMVSDMAGSSGSILNGKVGTGLPGPIGSLVKEISALPLFHSMDEKGRKEFSVWVSKLFNGTLLGERDTNGNLLPLKFDLRTEMGIMHQLGQQAMPIVVNECIVRGFYFIRRFFAEIKEKKVQKISQLGKLNWKNTLPFNNRTIARMMTIATSTFMAVDLADAAIRSSGNVSAFVLRVNFVGVGRFAIAVATDVGMGVKRSLKESERSRVLSELISLSNSKLFYKKADLMCAYSDLYTSEAQMFNSEASMWIELKLEEQAMQQLYQQINETIKLIIQYQNTYCEHYNEIAKIVKQSEIEIEKNNPGLLDEIFRR